LTTLNIYHFHQQVLNKYIQKVALFSSKDERRACAIMKDGLLLCCIIDLKVHSLARAAHESF
jgi:hypothetical protein